MESKGNGKQPVSVAMTFDDWYTSISIEGDMHHNMQRAWYAALLSSASSQDAIRNAALEEAANVCDESCIQPAIAKRIRALQSSPTQNGERPDVSDFETRRAIMEGERNAACNEYFTARPQIDFIGNRRIFEAGFQRGFESGHRTQSTAVRGNAQEPDLYEAEKLVPYETRYFKTKGMAEALGYKVQATYFKDAQQSSEKDAVMKLARECMQQYLDDHPHSAPDDCYATGHATGSPVFDLVRCPGCCADAGFTESIKAIDAAIAKEQDNQKGGAA